MYWSGCHLRPDMCFLCSHCVRPCRGFECSRHYSHRPVWASSRVFVEISRFTKLFFKAKTSDSHPYFWEDGLPHTNLPSSPTLSQFHSLAQRSQKACRTHQRHRSSTCIERTPKCALRPTRSVHLGDQRLRRKDSWNLRR